MILLYDLHALRQRAAELGYVEVAFNEHSRVIAFKKEGTRVNIYYTTGVLCLGVSNKLVGVLQGRYFAEPIVVTCATRVHVVGCALLVAFQLFTHVDTSATQPVQWRPSAAQTALAAFTLIAAGLSLPQLSMVGV